MAYSRSFALGQYLGRRNVRLSEICILPPFNTLHAQVIAREAPRQRIVTDGVTVDFTIPGNTYSAGRTNFWDNATDMLGPWLPFELPTNFGPNIGLTGTGSAAMLFS